MGKIVIFGAGGRARRTADPDFAVALIDEIDTPTHHRTHLGIEAA